FDGITLRPETRKLLDSHPTGRERVRLNRMLLEDAYPQEVTPREASSISIPRDIGILSVGALAYGALFLLLATIMSKPLMTGLVFAFGWETWVPNMPGRFQYVSIMSYLRTLAPHPQPPAETVDLIQFLSGMNHEVIATRTAWMSLGGIIGV